VLFAKAREEGIKIIAVDPVLSVTAAKADEWLPIRPGTDCAFILAMINVIINELQIYDQPFLKEMTNSPYLVNPDGYWLTDPVTGKVLVWDTIDRRAKEYDDDGIKDFALEGAYEVAGVLGKPAFQLLRDHVRQYTPEWASSITDIAASTIRRIAKEFVDNARIGSIVTRDGINLPYRPAATYIGRGVTGQIHSYQTILADHILAALIGSIEVPGGHRGGHTFTSSERNDGILWETCPPGSPNGIEPGEDGMLDVHHRPFQWPPTSYSGWEILTPFVDVQRYKGSEKPSSDPSQTIFGIDQLDWLNLTNPPKDWPVPPFPEVWIRHCTNPLLAVGEPKYALDVIRRIPFIVSISYTMDEITDFADIVLPENIELEKYKAHFATSLSGHKKYFALGLRQPVITPPCDTMDVNDILTELAERAGFLEEFNLHMNEVMGFSAPYKLEPGRKYLWSEIVDKLCRYYTNGAYDLEWFKKNGALVRPATVAEQYDIHLGMKAKKVRYPVPYMLEVKKAGEKLAHNLAERGIDWWPTADYTALPTYLQPILVEAPADYDFYVVNCRVASVAWGMNVGLPWVIEVSGQVKGVGDVLMNANAARDRGIKEGDEIWIESPAGKVKQKVKLGQGIRPDCLLISGQFGQWTMPIAKDTGRASFSTLVPLRVDWTDKVTGNQQSLVVKAKIYKAA
jgi:phenylacetyl-CoA:acceptor oxidoreductase